ncbi:hypothetical protein BDR04DRAFT_1114287 [Suillus decipiens]|nr:hypothetical protein BDR04DRAFT_1114287 [Suillus decipiens]
MVVPSPASRMSERVQSTDWERRMGNPGNKQAQVRAQPKELWKFWRFGSEQVQEESYKAKFDFLGAGANVEETYGLANASAVYISSVIKPPRDKHACSWCSKHKQTQGG